MQKPRGGGEGAGGAERSRAYALGAQSVEAPALPAGLHVVATPIGNLRDVTLRALETLAAADLIACEDTRVTRRLLERYVIATPTTPYHEHNAASARPRLLARMRDGAALALVSDAGTPLISDPGFKLVEAARAEGLPVTAVPGPSAVVTALASAGLPTDRFFFAGFLPAKASARRERIAALARVPATLVLFEAGPRVPASLRDLAQGLGARAAAVCRELTKLHEEVRRESLPALADHYAGKSETRGEFVLVVGPPAEAPAASESEIEALLRAALARGSVRDAVAEVADATGQPRAAVYKRALALRGGG